VLSVYQARIVFEVMLSGFGVMAICGQMGWHYSILGGSKYREVSCGTNYEMPFNG